MAQYQAVGLPRPAFMQAFGNMAVFDDTVTIPAALTTGDSVDLIRIPAGTRLTSLAFVNGDCDTGTGTLAGNIGWRSASGQAITVNGSSASANATAFASASGLFAAPSSVAARPTLSFVPITFNDDVFITFIPTTNANALAAAATITTIAEGAAVGVK